jgi:hypothetical protein
MTTFFTLQSKVRGFTVTSIDHTDHGAPTEQLKQLGVNLHTLDLLSDATAEPMRELLDSLPTQPSFFVDNGNKHRESELNVPYVKLAISLPSTTGEPSAMSIT